MRKLPFSALVVLGLATIAGGLWLAGDAAALDPPGLARKAAKGAVKGPVLPKGPLAVRGPALGKGPLLGKGPALGKGPVLGKDAALSKGPQLGKGGLPGNRLGAGTHQPAALHKAAIGPQGGPRPGLGRAFMGNFGALRAQHRQAMLAVRARLPLRPLPFERGFTGVPPAGETRFVTNEVVFQARANVTQQAVDAAMRRLGLSVVASQSVALTGGTLLRLRMTDRRQMAELVRALEAENIGVAQPNYVYRVQQDASLAARTAAADPGQYVVSKLRLGDVHRAATGSNVLVAVIDSAIDAGHPDLAGAVVEQFDAVGRRDRPHVHGTGMAGAIAAHRQLRGVAPAARILAVSAFSPEGNESPQATTQHILAGLEWAIRKGARVINMSFAGPHDPMLQLAMKNAREKGVVLVAAAGNLGPKSGPLYPAADPNVIAVTATDADDRHFGQANQGAHVAVAAPGVDVLASAPNGTYQLTTGTSVAAAHVSGVAALLIERDPSLDPAAVHEILTLSARDLGAKGRDDKFGWGLVDPARALEALDAKIAEDRKGTKPAAAKPAAAKPAAAKPAAAKPGAVSAR